MSVGSLTAANWTVSTRQDGEVLAIWAGGDDLQLGVFATRDGFSPTELDGWLKDLVNVARESARADVTVREIPALLHHALTGLLFSHAELWERAGGMYFSAALIYADGLVGVGWVGEADLQVHVDGIAQEVDWIGVRDREGREASAATFDASLPIRFWISWNPGMDEDSGVAVDAEWSREPRSPGDATQPFNDEELLELTAEDLAPVAAHTSTEFEEPEVEIIRESEPEPDLEPEPEPEADPVYEIETEPEFEIEYDREHPDDEEAPAHSSAPEVISEDFVREREFSPPKARAPSSISQAFDLDRYGLNAFEDAQAVAPAAPESPELEEGAEAPPAHEEHEEHSEYGTSEADEPHEAPTPDQWSKTLAQVADFAKAKAAQAPPGPRAPAEPPAVAAAHAEAAEVDASPSEAAEVEASPSEAAGVEASPSEAAALEAPGAEPIPSVAARKGFPPDLELGAPAVEGPPAESDETEGRRPARRVGMWGRVAGMWQKKGKRSPDLELPGPEESAHAHERAPDPESTPATSAASAPAQAPPAPVVPPAAPDPESTPATSAASAPAEAPPAPAEPPAAPQPARLSPPPLSKSAPRRPEEPEAVKPATLPEERLAPLVRTSPARPSLRESPSPEIAAEAAPAAMPAPEPPAESAPVAEAESVAASESVAPPAAAAAEIAETAEPKAIEPVAAADRAAAAAPAAAPAQSAPAKTKRERQEA
ncbi:MAG: hypothetical protein ACRENS_04685, partial [Candidatus Eiseniibacteriota bacterium]